MSSAAPSGPRRPPGVRQLLDARRAIWLGVAVLGVGVAWIVVTGLVARHQLQSVRAELERLQRDVRTTVAAGGNSSRVAADLAEMRSQAAHAQALTSGPAWWTAAHIPFLGAPARTVRSIAAATHTVAGAARPLVDALHSALPVEQQASAHAVDLHPLQAATGPLHAARHTLRDAAAQLNVASGSWFGPVSRAYGQLDTALRRLDARVTTISNTVDAALRLLGADGPHRYFVAFENEAESRGIGGLPGAFAILTADHGQLQFTHFGNDNELKDAAVSVPLGSAYTASYAQDRPTSLFVNSDISPNFPDAAKIWAAMWQQVSGQSVDGAFALDPTALSYLLARTGPARMPEGQAVTASTVVALTEQRLYAEYPDVTARKALLVDVARAVSQRLLAATNLRGVASAFGAAAGDRRILAWSSSPATERILDALGFAGTVRDTGRPYSGFVVDNAAGTKLDYYLSRSMTYRRETCGDQATVTAQLRLTNDAPTAGLPTYVTTRRDSGAANSRPGDNRLLVTYYASKGSVVDSVAVDGQPVTVATGTENGLVTVTVDVEIAVQHSATVDLHLTEPASDRKPVLLEQPLVRPLSVHVERARCG